MTRIFRISFPIFVAHLFAALAPASTPLPANSIANAVKLDSVGNLYVAGYYSASSAGNALAHAFVAKLSPDASRLIWWTPLAGSQDDRAKALAVGPGNSVYVTGDTKSPDFPTTPGVFDSSFSPSYVPPAGVSGGTSANTFVARLDPYGNVVYSTYLPATTGQAITTDAAGNAFITGLLSSGDALKATPGAVAGAPTASGPPGNLSGSFVVELDPSGSRSLLSIIGFGGTQIARDGSGNIYAAGLFGGPVAPTTSGAFQTTAGNSVCSVYCAYQHIAKINPAGTQLIYATYLSGIWGATPTGLVVDNAGNAIIAGITHSPDYPTTPGAWQPEYFGVPGAQYFPPTSFPPPPSVGFVTKLNATGTGLLWSTLFGGSGGQIPSSITVGDSIAGMGIDANGNIIIAGAANSPDLPGLWNTPVAMRPVAINGISTTGFAARFSADGSMLSPVQLLNGLGLGQAGPGESLIGPTGGAVAVRADGSVFVVGSQVFTVSFASLGRITHICDPADNAKIVRVAPGQLLTLYGTNLAPTGVAPAAASLPVSLNGVSVMFNGIAAPLLFTSGGQINLQVPYEIAGQSQVTMQVTSQSVALAISESYILGVAARQPSIVIGPAEFSSALADYATCNGQVLAGLQPLAINADGTLNSCSNPAAPGSTVTVFMNGLGVVTPAQSTGAVASSTVAISPAAAPGPITGTFVPTPLPTFTLAGSISSLAQVRIQAGATSSVVVLDGGTSSVRGPGIVIWSGDPFKTN